jgi:hypothetical protein
VTVDALHPTVKGYQIWADALEPVLTELLGPRAATDQAPPPTGDPSARAPRRTAQRRHGTGDCCTLFVARFGHGHVPAAVGTRTGVVKATPVRGRRTNPGRTRKL